MANLTFQWEGDINVVGGEVKKDGVPISSGSSEAAIEAIGGNYIDNSNFSVNTNGEAEYTYVDTAIYTVDRWYIDGGILTPKGNGVQLQNTNTDSGTESLIRLKQNIPYTFDTFAGKTLTLSAKINGTVYSGSATLPEEKPTTGTDSSTAVQYIAIGVAEYGINLNYSITGDYFVPYVALAYNQDVLIEWMKLEIGDSATPYVAPDYTTEQINMSFMNDTGNLSMPYTKEEVDSKIDGINASSLMVTTNNGEFKYQNGVVMTESFNIYNQASGAAQGKIIEIDNYYFVRESPTIACYKGVANLKNRIVLANFTLLASGGMPLTDIQQMAIIPTQQEKQYQIYAIQDTAIYSGSFRIEELTNGQILVENLGIEIENNTNSKLVYSRKKVYLLPGLAQEILVFPNNTDYRAPKTLSLLGGAEFRGAQELACSPDDDLFVYCAERQTWGWCDQGEDGALIWYMGIVENGDLMSEFLIQRIFKWGKYIIGQCDNDFSNGAYYYWTKEDYNLENIIVEADKSGTSIEENPRCWIGCHEVLAPMPSSLDLGSAYYNGINGSKNFLVVSGNDYMGIYRDLISNPEELPLSRINQIFAVIEDSEYLYISGGTAQYRVPFRTFEISLEEAINRLK